MRVVHLFRGVVGGGRFAITACSEPNPLKKYIHTTRYIGDVSCKRCLKAIDKRGLTNQDDVDQTTSE